jgi:type II secretory pathway pseudopilin PulG
MRSPSGASQVEFLAVLLIVCIGLAIAWPHFSLSLNASAEAKAISTLKVVHEAQKDFFGGRRYYGSEQQLKDFGALTGVDLAPQNNMAAVGVQTRITYSIVIQVSGGRQNWCAVAVPNPSGRLIAIDDAGKVQMDKTCYDGTVQ